MIDQNLQMFRQNWVRSITSMLWGQWMVVDTGLQAARTVFGAATPASAPVPPQEKPAETGADKLMQTAAERMRKGLAPPREIYQAPYRDRIDWSQFSEWARPCDPELFEGAGHEG
jgi:hypothetical protein